MSVRGSRRFSFSMSVVRFRFRSFAACRLLPARTLERTPDQRQLESADVRLEVESFVGQPRTLRQGGLRRIADLRAEVGDIYLRTSLTERQRPFDDVLELPHVTGPGVGHQSAQGVLRDRHGRPPDIRAELLEKVLHEQRNIVAALAQRRQLDRYHIEPVEEILTERTIGHHPREIGVRCGDDSYVDLDGVRVADALELTLLQHPQQLRLERGAHRSDLVEEQRALVRLLETSLPCDHRAGERAAHVPEQLRLEQRFGDGAAVDRDEAIGPPRAAVMNRACGQLLSGAGLACDQHRARCRRDGLEEVIEVPHHAAGTDESFDAVSLIELGSEVCVLGSQPALLQCRAEHVQQRIELKRLGDEVGRTLLDGVHRIFHGAVPGDHDRDDVRVPLERRRRGPSGRRCPAVADR